MSSRHFGTVPGTQEGDEFPTRQALHDVGIHPPTQAGISGVPSRGQTPSCSPAVRRRLR